MRCGGIVMSYTKENVLRGLLKKVIGRQLEEKRKGLPFMIFNEM